MVKDQKSDRTARLAALRDRIKNQEMSGGGAGFFSPEQGLNTIRILPEVGEMEYFYQPVGNHQFPGTKKHVYCPRFTSDNELPCPVCELVDDLYKSGDKDLAKEMKVRRSFWMNIINRSDESKGPLIYTPGEKVFNAISGYVQDDDYGDVFNPETGCDIKIEREGEGLATTYPSVRAGKPTPLGDDEDQINEWLEKAKDLSPVELSEDPDQDKELSEGHAIYLLPYDRIVKEFHLEGDLNWADEEDKPAHKPAKANTRPTQRVEEEGAPRARRSLRR